MLWTHVLPSSLSRSKSFALFVPFVRNLSQGRRVITKNLLDTIPQHLDHKIGVISTHSDIYHNLALEDYLYSNVSFTDSACILLIWIDEPCVVIGRHQNPWAELVTKYCLTKGIKVARRSSGGGTVFHDKGNINFSFITNRKSYNRRNNLTLLSDHLNHLPNVNCQISPREDIVTETVRDGEKITAKVSGTAAKLSSKNAYHHCTLLVNSNLENLRKCLRKSLPPSFTNRATSSVPSPIVNITSLTGDHKVSTTDIADSFINSFTPKVFEIFPSETTVPGIEGKVATLSSWDWVYGKTPKFILKRDFNHEVDPFTIEICVNHGLVDSFIVSSIEKPCFKLKVEGSRFDPESLKDNLLMWSLIEDDLVWCSNVVKGLDTLLVECIV